MEEHGGSVAHGGGHLLPARLSAEGELSGAAGCARSSSSKLHELRTLCWMVYIGGGGGALFQRGPIEYEDTHLGCAMGTFERSSLFDVAASSLPAFKK